MIIELTKSLMKKVIETEQEWMFGTQDTFLFNGTKYTLSKERMNPPGKKFHLYTNDDSFNNTYKNMSDALLDMINSNGNSYSSLKEYFDN